MLREDAIWSVQMASAAAAVSAKCAVPTAAAAAPPLEALVGAEEEFPANCGSAEAEDGPGGLAAVCATLRNGGADPVTREVRRL